MGSSARRSPGGNGKRRRVSVRQKERARLGYWVYDGATVIELFDYWHNAMHFAKRFAKALNKGPVRYVRENDASPTK
jgi:hypothetical protein